MQLHRKAQWALWARNKLTRSACAWWTSRWAANKQSLQARTGSCTWCALPPMHTECASDWRLGGEQPRGEGQIITLWPMHKMGQSSQQTWPNAAKLLESWGRTKKCWGGGMHWKTQTMEGNTWCTSLVKPMNLPENTL